MGELRKACCDSPFLYWPFNVFKIFEALSKTRFYVIEQHFN